MIETKCFTSNCELNIDNECLVPAWTPNCPGRIKNDMPHIIRSIVEGARRLAQITDREIERQTIQRWKDRYEKEW